MNWPAMIRSRSEQPDPFEGMVRQTGDANSLLISEAQASAIRAFWPKGVPPGLTLVTHSEEVYIRDQSGRALALKADVLQVRQAQRCVTARQRAAADAARLAALDAGIVAALARREAAAAPAAPPTAQDVLLVREPFPELELTAKQRRGLAAMFGRVALRFDEAGRARE